MELFQILDCSTIGTCCTDYSLVAILNITRKIFELLQLIVPIALLIACTVQFVQLSINPEMKDGFRRILNKFIAAIIVFAVPFLVDTILTAVPGNLNISSCWQQAKLFASENLFNSGVYYGDDESSNKVFMNPDEYDTVNENNIDNSKDTTSSSGVSAKQKAIVSYAKQFVNKNGKLTYKYKRGGSWNGEKPYTTTDCSGFVKGVVKHVTGVNLPRKVKNMWKERSKYFDQVSEKNLEPGDIIMYDGHVGIYTGKGKQIIHNKGTSWGIIINSNYNKASKHGKPIGFLRVKGVKS